jgi:hypothetical protein
MRKRYRTGTVNIGKQVLENHSLNYAVGKHRCSKSMTHRAERTARTDDRWIYQYDRAKEAYQFFKVVSIVSGNDCGAQVCPVNISDFCEGDLQWGKVGVYQFEGVSEKSEAMDLTAMDGKAIICEDLIISIPYSTLMENK